MSRNIGGKLMSELINNREKNNEIIKRRQEILKDIILKLHEGKDVKSVKEQFASLIEGVSANEISSMEASLIKEGMAVEEIQRLCDVHAEIFKGSIEEIHKVLKEEEKEGHPVKVLKKENAAIEDLINKSILIKSRKLMDYNDESNLSSIKVGPQEIKLNLLEDINLLLDIDKHYSRKENILFPYMEKYGITAPPKVMWGVDDEIRREIKYIKSMLQSEDSNISQLNESINNTSKKIVEMIFKEENIMLPMLLDTLTEDEWIKIAEDSDEIGYCIVSPVKKWVPERKTRILLEDSIVEQSKKAELGDNNISNGYVNLGTGILKMDELKNILNTLPFDITFIDKDDIVRYFSQSEERIFPRTKSVIGRSVQNCHPPASVHVVDKILNDFKSGAKNSEDFWISLKGMLVYIRYFAVRNDRGEYLGTLEVTQNIKPIRELTGEKRLMS